MNPDVLDYVRRRAAALGDFGDVLPEGEAKPGNELPELDLSPEQSKAEPQDASQWAAYQPPPSAPPLVKGEDERERRVWDYLSRKMDEEEAPVDRETALGESLLRGFAAASGHPKPEQKQQSLAPELLQYLQHRATSKARTDDQIAMDKARLAEELDKKNQRQQAAERQAREDSYRREHDAAVLAQQKDNAEATRALAAAGLNLRERSEARQEKKDAEGTKLPAATATDLADLPTAMGQLDKLKSDFVNLDMSGWKGRAGAAFTNMTGAGWTDSAKFQDAVMVAMQGVGKIMEGGKLAAGDELKYKSMLPKGGDSPELAAKKIDEANGFLKSLVVNRLAVLQETGYRITPKLRSMIGLPAEPEAPEPRPNGARSGPESAPAAGEKIPMVSAATGKTVMLSPAAAAALEKSGKVRKP